MAGLAIDGLVSGLDTTALINSLIQLEAIPQNLLKKRVDGSQAMITALQGLNTKIASLAELAKSAAAPGSLDLYKATSSSTSVTTSVSSGAQAGSVDVVVGQLAQAQVSVSAAMTVWADDPAVITIKGSDGTQTEITAATTSLDDMVSAINASQTGVKAVKVSAGGGEFRLQFSAENTGTAGSFEVYRGTSAAVTDGTATNLLAEPGAAAIRTATDAELTLWAGTAAERTITSSTNTFAELLPGVSVTVSAVSADPVTVAVSRDKAAVSKVAEDLVAALNGVFALISTKSTVTNSKDAAGNPIVSAGLFTSDSTVRGVNQRILSAASLPVDGRSPSEIGISITKTGVLEFDSETFAKTFADDPARVGAVLTELATRVESAANQASHKREGELSLKITGQESLVKSMNTQVEEWNGRLESRRATLERTYSALEVQLSALNSQMAWLSSQIGSLPSREA
ncbi:MAG: flagellar filament capping protein FliD [Homoserinimonas sp.]